MLGRREASRLVESIMLGLFGPPAVLQTQRRLDGNKVLPSTRLREAGHTLLAPPWL